MVFVSVKIQRELKVHDIVNDQQCVIYKFQCDYKFDCLVHEMLLIRELTLSVRSSQTQFKQNYLMTLHTYHQIVL